MNSSIFLAIAAILAQVGIAQQIDTIAGNGQTGSTGDGAAALQATLASASAIAVDGSGNVYFNDTASARVRKISTSGIISTVAGNGSLGGSPKMVPTEGQPAISVALGPLRGLAVDAGGTLYISDQGGVPKG